MPTEGRLYMITISLCMIVKNEEKILQRCLDSYKDICDEIIIVDTGSTDSTVSIAQKYTDNIYHFEWCNDFATARNYAFDKATCDYIFSADADEVLDHDNFLKLLRLKNTMDDDIDIVQMKYVNSDDYNTVYNCKKEYRPKLFKRIRHFTWISPIHETIRLNPVVYDSDIEILHMPENIHSKRDFSTFINAINNGEVLADYVIIMLCKELFISGGDEDFINFKDIFENVLVVQNHSDECMENISCVLARIYRLINDYNSFFKICLKNIAVTPCSEICMELGLYFKNIKDYDEAVLWFINASSETSPVIEARAGGDKPLYEISECYRLAAAQAQADGNTCLSELYINNSLDYERQAKEWVMPEEL